MQVIQAIDVNASAKDVWDIAGVHFNDIEKWASNVIRSVGNPDLPAGSGRICTVDGGQIIETFTNFSDAEQKFTYEAKSKTLPFFVRSIHNTWDIKAKGSEKSTVRLTVDADLMPVFAQVMGPVMKGQLSKSFGSMLEEFKYYAETGKARPGK